MDFQIFPVAEASVETLMKSINKVIINPIIYFLFACAMTYFLYGLAQYLLSPDNEEIRKTSKSHMLWGLIGLFIMVAVFGIMNLILGTVGETNIKIQSNGDYSVSGMSSGTHPSTDSYDLNKATTGATQDNTLGSTVVDVSSSIVTNDSSFQYTKSPFPQYVANPLCWRAEIMGMGTTEYQAHQVSTASARTSYLQESGLSEATADKNLPKLFGVQTAYDKVNKKYYVWRDVRAPINGGVDSDCNLVAVQSTAGPLPAPSSESTKQSKLMGKYQSTASTYYVLDSGVSPVMETAKSIAIKNALIQIAQMEGLNSTDGINYQITEQTMFSPDSTSGNYDFFVVLESPRDSVPNAGQADTTTN